MSIDLKPRKVVRWIEGRRTELEKVQPQPFTQERAREIWAQRGPLWILPDNALTPEEYAYVLAIWDTLSGNSCWMDAFLKILNGRI